VLTLRSAGDRTAAPPAVLCVLLLTQPTHQARGRPAAAQPQAHGLQQQGTATRYAQQSIISKLASRKAVQESNEQLLQQFDLQGISRALHYICTYMAHALEQLQDAAQHIEALPGQAPLPHLMLLRSAAQCARMHPLPPAAAARPAAQRGAAAAAGSRPVRGQQQQAAA
jgi:hypothetical protein